MYFLFIFIFYIFLSDGPMKRFVNTIWNYFESEMYVLWAPSSGGMIFNLGAKGLGKSQKVLANLIYYKRFYTW